jgi:hypothetical protein
VLRRTLHLLQREGIIQRNPAARIGELMRRIDTRLTGEVQEVEHWTRSDVERLLAPA